MFSSKSFSVFSLIFIFLIHFQFIFVYSVRKCSNLIFFTCDYPVFTVQLIEETLFSIVSSCLLCCRLTIGMLVYSWAFYTVPLNFLALFVPILYCFDYSNIVVQSEVMVHDSTSSAFIPQDCFGYLGSLVSSKNCKIFVLVQ